MEFKLAFCARKLTNAWFTVYARENEQGYSRLGIAASKRVMPTAVSRNLAKRLIRETFRQGFPAEKAVDVVVVPRQAIETNALPTSRLALEQLLQRV
jgi:ribonuclease P protein component